jgi:hypothetical protein
MSNPRQDRSAADDTEALSKAARLWADDKWQELGQELDTEIRCVVLEGMERFKAAGYPYDECAPAVSFALLRALAMVEKPLVITPEDFGRMAADMLRKVRKTK